MKVIEVEDYVDIAKCKNCKSYSNFICLERNIGVGPNNHCASFDEITSRVEEIKSELFENMYSLPQLISQGVPELKWRVENILPENGICFFGGTAGSMKSWAGMQLGLACATGKPFLNKYPTKQCSVLYIDEENGNVTIPYRFDKLIKGSTLDINELHQFFITIFKGISFDSIDGKIMLKSIIEKCKPELIIIDSMVRCIEGDENKSEDVKKVFVNLKEYLQEGISFVILHHTTKGDTNSMAGLRGSGDFAAFADCVMMFQAIEGSMCNVKMVKNRHIGIDELCRFSFGLESSEKGIVLDWKGKCKNKQTKVEKCQEFVEDWIQEKWMEAFHSRVFFNLITSQGYSKACGYRVLDNLKKVEKVVENKQGHYTINSSKFDLQMSSEKVNNS